VIRLPCSIILVVLDLSILKLPLILYCGEPWFFYWIPYLSISCDQKYLVAIESGIGNYLLFAVLSGADTRFFHLRPTCLYRCSELILR